MAFARRRLAARAVISVAVLALLATAITALVERFHAPAGAADRALAVVCGLWIPLLSFALVGLAAGPSRLSDSVWPLARHGASRRGLILGLLLATMCIAALLAGAVAWLGVQLCHHSLALLDRDAATSGWIGALGAAAYVGWFGFGATVMRRGRGRYLALLADFTLGFGVGVPAVLWPRAHLANLIGGPALLGLPQSSSSVALAGIAVTLLLASALRTAD